MPKFIRRCLTAGLIAAIAFCGAFSRPVNAEATASDAVPALLLSDIHFDPFHDPDRVKRLATSPVSEWTAILAPASTPAEEQAFTGMQQACHARGIDTPYVLLHSSLQAMRTQQPSPKFVTVSGDLIAHSFFCRYKAVFPNASQADYESFVLKTISFVEDELKKTVPGVPIYLALGNNDTPCDDYRLDANSKWLAEAGKILAEGLPSSDRTDAAKQFATGGYYSLALQPLRSTRLIVVNDLFWSGRYRNCAGQPDPAAANAQMKWLQAQLEDARKQGQSVWVMAHIPPGVDPFSTVMQFKDVCGSGSAEMFLDTDEFARVLMQNADVVRLGLFGHTHMDEMHLLHPDEAAGAKANDVAVKLVPSISPVNGNRPAFTIARVNDETGVLKGYEVIAASNKTGIGASWTKEYDYVGSFHEKSFSAEAMKHLDATFRDDRHATSPLSDAYIRHFYAGAELSQEMKPFWPQYVCAMDNYTAKGFAGCVCSPGK